MNFLSLNLRGLGDASKKLSIKHIISSFHLFIIFIKESMCANDRSHEYFLSICSSWHLVVVDSCGLFAFMRVVWDLKWVNMKAYKSFAHILLLHFISGFSCHLHFINIYMPCQDKPAFSQRLDACGVLKTGSLLIVGDLNATMFSEEYWGSRSRSDPLATQLHVLFEANHLVDIQTHPLTPTWSNGKVGENHIGKRLDQFLVHEKLLEVLGNTRSWVVWNHILDHLLIVLQWRREDIRRGIPFKFNRMWLGDGDFFKIVNNFWS